MKHSSFIQGILTAILASWCMVYYPALNAAPLTLANDPLFLSSGSVEPNVMFLLDNSGSMNNIIWDDGYDPGVSYPHWGGTDWSATNGNMKYVAINSCTSSQQSTQTGTWKRGVRNGVTKCLKLPTHPDIGTNTRFAGNYLNYLYETYPHLTDLNGTIPRDYRMQVARDVATNTITSTGGMRFGLTRFGSGSSANTQGGRIEAQCGAAQSTVTSAIANLTASTWTPLAEAYYEITRYFRGMRGYYNSSSYTSPIQYRCQKNFVIVITDGLPTFDNAFPGDDPADMADTGASLPNWDGLAPATTSAMYPNFPQYSDGFSPGSNQGSEGSSLYLDDLAKFGNDIDLKTSGTDGDGMSYDAPDYPQQNLITYTVGFSTNNQMLEDAAAYGKGEYYTANDAATLTTALQNAITDIQGRTSAAAAVSLNSSSIQQDSILYQARFNSEQWGGELRYISILADGSIGPTTVKAHEVLEAQDPANGRVIISYRTDTAKGIPFRAPADYGSATAGELSVTQITALLTNAPYSSATTDGGEKAANQVYLDSLVAYLRGDRGNEVQNGGGLRDRSRKLGDITHSGPTYVGAPSSRYDFDGYPAWSEDSGRKNRTPMVYVGANDGMLHGFDAATGQELIAYVPAGVYSNLHRLAMLSYNENHRYFVDGTPSIGDAYYNGAWHTILVGGLRGGGRGYFALDVTNPDDFSEANAADAVNPLVLWEFGAADDADLGYSYSQATIVKMANNKWAAVFGNGYNHTGTGKAALFIAFIEGGLDGVWTLDTDYLKLVTAAGTPADPNGLAHPAVIDVDGDAIADYIYAGDLMGNMWRFDVHDPDPGNWAVGHGGGPLFTALNVDAEPQAITTRPQVGLHPDAYNYSGYMVYFGTGKYLEPTDSNSLGRPTQSVYGIWDNFAVSCLSSSPTPCSSSGAYVRPMRNDLRSQEIVAEVNAGTSNYRLLSDNDIVWPTHKGWFLDLVDPDDGLNHGERVATNVLLRNGTLFVTTMIPNTQVCGFGGTGWLMELDAGNGGRLDQSPFDVNGDGVFDADDLITDSSTGTEPVAASGLLITDGIPSGPIAAYVNSAADNEYYEGSSSGSQTGGSGNQGGGGSGSGGSGAAGSSGAKQAHDRIYINTGAGVIKQPIVQDQTPPGRQYWRQLK